VKGLREYPKPDLNDVSSMALLPQHNTNYKPLPCAPPLQKAVQFCPLSRYIHRLKWWLTNHFADYKDIFHLFAEMGNGECNRN